MLDRGGESTAFRDAENAVEALLIRSNGKAVPIMAYSDRTQTATDLLSAQKRESTELSDVYRNALSAQSQKVPPASPRSEDKYSVAKQAVKKLIESNSNDWRDSEVIKALAAARSDQAWTSLSEAHGDHQRRAEINASENSLSGALVEEEVIDGDHVVHL